MDTSDRLMKIPGIGIKRAEKIQTTLKTLNKTIDDLFTMPAAEIKNQFGLPIKVAEAIISKVEKNNLQLTNNKNILTVVLGEKDYPQKLVRVLGKKSPSTLQMWGNLALLQKPAVGFCGSRNITEKGIEVTTDTVQQIVALGWVVISGHARGVDINAHKTTLENGGSTIIVLAEGLQNFKLRQEIKKLVTWDNLLIISEFKPEAHWTIGNAMTRNQTIIGLSDAMVLIESRLEGGTFNAGKAALRLKVPLLVADYQTPTESNSGNAYFLQRGANVLSKNRETGRANITTLKTLVSDKQTNPINPEKQQLPLF